LRFKPAISMACVSYGAIILLPIDFTQVATPYRNDSLSY
jgi:hypothetical protein